MKFLALVFLASLVTAVVADDDDSHEFESGEISIPSISAVSAVPYSTNFVSTGGLGTYTAFYPFDPTFDVFDDFDDSFPAYDEFGVPLPLEYSTRNKYNQRVAG